MFKFGFIWSSRREGSRGRRWWVHCQATFRVLTGETPGGDAGEPHEHSPAEGQKAGPYPFPTGDFRVSHSFLFSQDIPRAFHPQVPAPQVPRLQDRRFKSGCAVEHSHGAARWAGLYFKSPRPISNAQALVTFPALRLNSGRR